MTTWQRYYNMTTWQHMTKHDVHEPAAWPTWWHGGMNVTTWQHDQHEQTWQHDNLDQQWQHDPTWLTPWWKHSPRRDNYDSMIAWAQHDNAMLVWPAWCMMAMYRQHDQHEQAWTWHDGLWASMTACLKHDQHFLLAMTTWQQHETSMTKLMNEDMTIMSSMTENMNNRQHDNAGSIDSMTTWQLWQHEQHDNYDNMTAWSMTTYEQAWPT
jgi:hypothetical protein